MQIPVKKRRVAHPQAKVGSSTRLQCNIHAVCVIMQNVGARGIVRVEPRNMTVDSNVRKLSLDDVHLCNSNSILYT